MYNDKHSGKHYIPAHRRQRLRRRRQQHLIIGIVAILCSIISCVSLAYILTHTDSVKNVFDRAYVACDVLENGTDENIQFDGVTKSNVRIQNTGNVQSYIRATVIVTWMSGDQTKVTSAKPVDDTDYVITYADETGAITNWEKGKDGYWYYKIPVDVDGVTENLIESCSLKDGVTPPKDFYLSVEIVASSIQSTPPNVVKEQWDSGVEDVSETILEIRQ